MNIGLIWQYVSGAVSGIAVLWYGAVKVWVIKHQVDFAALVKLLEEQYADGIWLPEEKKIFADETIKRLVLVGLPWYIPKWLALRAINSFIDKVLIKAKEIKPDLKVLMPAK